MTAPSPFHISQTYRCSCGNYAMVMYSVEAKKGYDVVCCWNKECKHYHEAWEVKRAALNGNKKGDVSAYI